MQEQILVSLHNSLIGDNATLKMSNQKISQLSKMQGYCSSLMQIINEPNLKSDIKQAALVQLKNNVKAKWKPKNSAFEITAAQKNNIRGVLVKAIVLCAKQHKLIKLYRQVLTTIIGYEYETWIPISQIIQIIKTGTNLPAAFHCIIAICTNFQFSVIEKQKITYNIFLKEMLPIVFETVKNNLHNLEVLYLSLKILWKTVHYQINNEIKMLTNNWMELLYLVISEINQDMQKIVDEIQNKNTTEFYYFHSKKWATRILMRYVQKHAKATTFGKINVENAEYSKFWYQNYGMKLCSVIVTQLSQGRSTTKKIRYFQLKIIQGIINDKPQLISQFAQQFQQQILIKYMIVTKNDEDQANSDVVEYLRSDDQSSMTHSNIKRVATQVWNNFLQLQSRFDRDVGIYYPGPNFQRNLGFMFEKIRSENFVEKELGMYLFCENRITINRIPEVKKEMPALIDMFVIPLLTESSVLIRSRANDMIHQYGKQIHDVNILGKCLSGVYMCLIQQQSPLVKIKAGIALNSLAWHPQSKLYLKDHLPTILKVYLDIIRQYDLQQVVSALQYFIGQFSQDIGPFAIDLFKCLFEDLFVKMFNKDIELSQNQEYGSQVELAASGCIKTMTQIIESPLSMQIRAQIQPLVLQLCNFLFTSQSYDYHEDMFFLLRVHIEKIDRITPQCWFYYQVIIYFIVGIPNEQFNQIQSSPLPDLNKKILSYVREGNNFQFLEFAVPILRNYLGKGQPMILAQKEEFKLNVVHLIIYLVVQVYKKGVSVELEGEIHLDCCSIMLVYLLESFPEEMSKALIIPIWNVCNYNITKGQSRYLKQITCQIIGLLLWKHSVQFLQILVNENNLPVVVKHLVKVGSYLQEYQQRKRVILGLCQYLLITQNQQILLKYVPTLTPVLFRLVKKNCVTRVIFNTTNQELRKKFQQMEDNDSDYGNNENDQDDDDMWDEEYNEKHCSILKNYNQLAYFSETIKKLGAENQNLSQIIINSSTPQKIQTIEGLLSQAIQLKER